jgi:hypothetical protein
MPFDPKIEPIAQRVVRARIALDEAQLLADMANEDFKAVIAEGQKYVTKDGETVSHAKGAVRRSPVVETLRGFLTGSRLRIWKSVRVDAVDMKKLLAYVETGELDMLDLVDSGCVEELQCKSSVRVNFPSTRSARASGF